MGRLLGRDERLVNGTAILGRRTLPSITGAAVRERAWRLAVSPAFVVFAATLALDVPRLQPGVGVWDTAEYQTLGTVLGIAHPTGFPSYTLLAWLASVVFQPIGEPALRANLLSAVLAATATSFVAATAMALTRRPLAAIAAGLVLAVNPIAWAIGIRADAHALHFAVVSVLLYTLVRWWLGREAGEATADRWLVAASVVFAVGVGGHPLVALLAPGIAIYLFLVAPRLPVSQPRVVLACAVTLLMAIVALYAYLPIRSAMNPPLDYGNPETWEGFRYVVLGEEFGPNFRGLPDPVEVALFVPRFLVEQLGIFALFAGLGAVFAARFLPSFFVLSAAWFVPTLAFTTRFTDGYLDRYYLGPLVVAAVWTAIGLEGVWLLTRSLRERAAARMRNLAVVRDTRLAAAAPLVLALLVLAPIALAVPGNVERSGHARATATGWMMETLERLPRDAVVVSFWSYATTLRYGQFAIGLRPDITVIDEQARKDRSLGTVDDVVKRYFGQRPVFVIPLGGERYLPQGFLYRTIRSSSGWTPIWEVLQPAA
jgi:hypothetical protein